MKEEIISFYSQDASHRLILLHGWGADANDLIPFGKGLAESLGIRFELVALNAPELHPDGLGRQWYGLFPADWDSVSGAIQSLKNRLKTISTNQIPLEKTFLLGFSQGGAMALGGGCDFPFAGLICCSSYPHPGWKPPSKTPPILLIHGREDSIVPLEALTTIVHLLESSTSEFETYIFPGGHHLPNEATSKICLFINKYI